MKTITYDETKFQLLPIRLDGNMLEAAANTELLANRNHGEPASISDLWDALRAAAPQPECVEHAADFEQWLLRQFPGCDLDEINAGAVDLARAAYKAGRANAAAQETSHDDQ